LLDVAPAAVIVLLPAVAFLLVDVAVVAGVHVAAARTRDRRPSAGASLVAADRLAAALPCDTRVVVPVTLLVTRDVRAQSSRAARPWCPSSVALAPWRVCAYVPVRGL